MNAVHAELRECSLHPITKQRTITILERALDRIGEPPPVEPLEHASRIVSDICAACNVSQYKLRSKSRKTEVVVPRQLAMYLIRKQYGAALSERTVGKMFRRDRTTVLHAVRLVDTQMADNNPVITKYYSLYINYKTASAGSGER